MVLELWAQWVEQAVFLLLQLKVLLDLLLAAFLLVLRALEALLLEVLHNLEVSEEEPQVLVDYLVRAHQSAVLLPLTILIIFHLILLKSSELKNQSNLTKKKPKKKKLKISNRDLQNTEQVL